MPGLLDIPDGELDELVEEAATEEVDAVLDGIAAETVEECGLNVVVTEPLPDHLREVLERCVVARSLIKPEQAKLSELIEQAGSEVEREAREYQRDLIAKQLNRAASVAGRRLAHFASLTDFNAEQERCRLNKRHWFEMYAWGHDPRPDAPLSVMPLAPFAFQYRYLDWLDFITFGKRSSGVVEKARDMGATETTLRWMLYQWLYRPDFVGLVLSANEDLVDSKKDPGTLFEKLRFQMRLLPLWMLPKGFSLDRDMPYMQLSNPANGSILQGDAPTANVGRQRRATFVLKDESAAWANGGYQQHTALSRTANTICDVSSVQGKFNKFSDLAHDGKTPKFEMDWREHEWRDMRWYNALPYGVIGPAMTEEEIAQEIDRNYEASQPGRVLKNVREEYCFITWDELVKGFEPYGLSRMFYGPDGRFRIPEDWNWGRVSDYGQSAKTENDTHVWAYSLLARPSEGFPLTDSVFFFCSRPVEPIGASELEAFGFYSEIERQLGVRVNGKHLKAPEVNDFSHEAEDARDVLLKQCGDGWRIPDLDFFKGVSKLRFHFELTDKNDPNPFRPELPGRSRIYFVAPPGEYACALNERSGSYFVTPSKTQAGYKRLRAELTSWHFPAEERGKPVQKMRPKPVFDDVVTTVRYGMARWGVTAAGLSPAQSREKRLAPELQKAAVVQIEDQTLRDHAVHSRNVHLRRMEAEERNREQAAGRFALPRVKFRK